MIPILPTLLKDGYKIGHKAQYPRDTTLVYSNMTPRASRVDGTPGVIHAGLQYFILEYLIRQFREGFFRLDRDLVVKTYKRVIDSYLGPGTDVSHIGELHELGYLPLKIRAVPEGTLVPFRVPMWTVRNTDPRFFWLTNMLETLESNVLWGPTTSATTAFSYRRVFEEFARKTGADVGFVRWQGHDFSMRGMMGVEAAVLSAFGHALSFYGSDTVPVIPFVEEYYGAKCQKELIVGSVPATEHSVMCMGMEDGELETIRRLITETYPTGIVSIVCDTWDFWKVLTEYLPKLRPEIMARNGKLVVRPDSGNPVKIICGDTRVGASEVEAMGAIRQLAYTFGTTDTPTGHKLLDPHIGLIYGDSITPFRQQEILSRLAANGYASSNVVLGIGSYTYQYVTRDTFGFAMKATYGERTSADGVVTCQNISKNPKTDNGVKKSASGLLRVELPDTPHATPILHENQTWEEEGDGLLQTVFEDGKLTKFDRLSTIRKRVDAELVKLG